MSPAVRWILVAASLLALGGVGVVSVRETRAQLQVMEACEAARDGASERALDLTRDRVGSDATGRVAAECRCRALDALGHGAECDALLAGVAPQTSDWTPAPDLAERVARALVDADRPDEAAALAGRTRRAHPTHLDLWRLELDLRAALESEDRVIAALHAELPPDGDLAAMGRALLAKRALRLGDAPAALRWLGERPPSAGALPLSHWFDTKLTAHALNDDVASAQITRDAWLASGQSPAEVRARYALALSIAGIADPELAPIPLLERSLAEIDASPGAPARLHEGLAIRLVLTLASAGRLDDAVAVYDRYQQELGLDGLSRDELLRAARREALAGVAAEERAGTLRFRIRGAPPSAELWISPDEDQPADTSFERHELAGRTSFETTRREGEVPRRWVLRDGEQVLASGTVNPRAGSVRTVEVRAGLPVGTSPPGERHRREGDGTRRVALVLLDCGDWPIIRYLGARGELPTFDALLRDGRRALLHSDPPLTAAALEALVWPGRRGDASVLGLVHRMGVELAGLASIGDNPFDALRFVLPESQDLFGAVGRGERSAANLLLSHGGIRAGRHGEVTGPHGVRSRVPIGRARRALDARERTRFPALGAAANERDRLYIETMAAEFDATEELARNDVHDLLAVRIEPLDILTHANYADTTRDAQDDGERLLFSVYRYMDARLAEVDAALDADDVLIVMSDHGIRTAMEHSDDAFFVAVGPGIRPGRVAGKPDLRGVPLGLALLLGADDAAGEWPDTGIADYARTALASQR